MAKKSLIKQTSPPPHPFKSQAKILDNWDFTGATIMARPQTLENRLRELLVSGSLLSGVFYLTIQPIRCIVQ
jgi:hypothetical protein